MPYVEPIEKFSRLTSKWRGAHICAVHSYVGLKSPEGARLLLYGRSVFEVSRSSIDENPFSFETDHFFAHRLVAPVSEDGVAAALEKARTGHFGEFVDLIPEANSSQPFSPYFSVSYHPLTAKLFIRGAQRHYINTTAGFPDYLEWEMKTADTPFDTLDELLIFCGLPGWNDLANDNTRLELVVNAPGKIDGRSKIIDGKGVVRCRVARGLDSKKFKFGCRVFQRNREILRPSASGADFEWSDDEDFRVGEYLFPTGDAPVLEAYLSYDGTPLDQLSVADPKQHLNPRHAIHQLFDPSLERLRQMLFSPEKDKSQMSHVFEGAVSALFSLLGFSVSNYGRFRKLQDGPDIIATTLSGNVAIVECTLGLLDQNDKIAKLVQRAQQAREKLANAGYAATEIQPAIVTLCRRNEVAANMDVARDHGIAVICRENLEDLLNQVSLPPDAEQLYSELEKLVPESKQDLFGLSLKH
jgi:hypothetical protein